jgi:hypothetical protein
MYIDLPSEQDWNATPSHISSFSLLCWVEVHCGIYKYITIYQIHRTWIHLLHHSPLSSPPTIHGIVSTGIIFPFTRIYAQNLYHVHLPTRFPHLPSPSGTTIPTPVRTCSTLLFSDFINFKKWHFLKITIHISILYSPQGIQTRKPRLDCPSTAYFITCKIQKQQHVSYIIRNKAVKLIIS